jgi:hypothetical protein
MAETKTIFSAGDPPSIPALPAPHPPSVPPMPSPGIPSTPGQLAAIYDVWDGIKATLAAGSTTQLLNGATLRPCKFNRFTGICDETDVILKVYVSTNANPSIIATRAASGIWTVARYNGATGALLSTWTASGSSRACGIIWTDTNILTLASAPTDVWSEVIAGANQVNAFRYGLGGYTY